MHTPATNKRSRFSAAVWVTLLVCVACQAAGAGPAGNAREVSITQFGGRPDSGADTTSALNAAVRYCRENAIKALVFPRGKYHFYPEKAHKREYFVSNTDNSSPVRSIPIDLSDLRSFTLDGNGSDFIFHGAATALTIDNGKDVTLTNFTIDWDRPFVSQGTIVAASESGIELRFDQQQYPHVVRNGRAFATGEGWQYPLGLHVFLDENLAILPGTLDEPLGEHFFANPAIELAPGLIRFAGKPDVIPQPGTRMIWRHGKGDNIGIFIYRSSDVRLDNVNVYHAPGKAILAQRSESLTLDHTSVARNTARQRWVSSFADALHFSGCKGHIRVTHSNNTGQMDDWLNVHGSYTTISERRSDYQVIGKFNHRESRNLLLFGPGDAVAVLDPATGQPRQRLRVAEFELLPPQNYRISFAARLDAAVAVGDILENNTWTPSVHVSRSRILAENRARGLLITTPRRVTIEDNEFRSAGTPILIEGDINQWYESGAVRDVVIRNNRFVNTFASGIVMAKTVVPDSEGYYWGDASIVSVTPSFHPTGPQSPTYHRGIRIENNIMTTVPAPLIYARATRGLIFKANTVSVRPAPEARLPQPLLYFDGCRQARVSDNRFTGASEQFVQTLHMNDSDLTLQHDVRREDLRAEPASR